MEVLEEAKKNHREGGKPTMAARIGVGKRLFATLAGQLAKIEGEEGFGVVLVPEVIAVGSDEVFEPREEPDFAGLDEGVEVLELVDGSEVVLGGMEPVDGVEKGGLGPLVGEVDASDGAGIVGKGVAEIDFEEDKAAILFFEEFNLEVAREANHAQQGDNLVVEIVILIGLIIAVAAVSAVGETEILALEGKVDNPARIDGEALHGEFILLDDVLLHQEGFADHLGIGLGERFGVVVDAYVALPAILVGVEGFGDDGIVDVLGELSGLEDFALGNGEAALLGGKTDVVLVHEMGDAARLTGIEEVEALLELVVVEVNEALVIVVAGVDKRRTLGVGKAEELLQTFVKGFGLD